LRRHRQTRTRRIEKDSLMPLLQDGLRAPKLIFLAMRATELIRWHRHSHDEEVVR
jgi:hypothetical protein